MCDSRLVPYCLCKMTLWDPYKLMKSLTKTVQHFREELWEGIKTTKLPKYFRKTVKLPLSLAKTAITLSSVTHSNYRLQSKFRIKLFSHFPKHGLESEGMVLATHFYFKACQMHTFLTHPFKKEHNHQKVTA